MISASMQRHKTDLYIGIMSGTSLDGIDAALVAFSDGTPGMRATHYRPYGAELKETLLALHQPTHDELHQALLLGNALAREYAAAVAALLETAGVAATDIAAIGRPGQTPRHRPEPGHSPPIGNHALLAEVSGIARACTFPSAPNAPTGPGRTPGAAYPAVPTGQALARHLLDRYGMGVLPASAFGDEEHALRVRVATGLLYGDTDAQRELALASPGPLTLPWIAAALDRIEDILADLAAPRRCPPRIAGQVTGAGGQRRGTVSRVPSLSRTHSIRRSTLASSSRFITGQRASVSSMTAASAVTGSAVATTARTRTVWKCGRTDRSPWRPRMSIVNAASKSRDS